MQVETLEVEHVVPRMKRRQLADVKVKVKQGAIDLEVEQSAKLAQPNNSEPCKESTKVETESEGLRNEMDRTMGKVSRTKALE